MATVSVFNTEGMEVGTIDLNDEVFGVEINEHLVHQAVVTQLANSRQGTQSAKTRSEVSGGGRKPWRQKGTGHARQGSTRSPQWTGGGVVFAPKPRDYSKKMNKREKQIALKSALTSKVNDKKFIVVDDFKLDEIKTKKVVEILKNLKAEEAFVVTNGVNDNLVKSVNNLPAVKAGTIELVKSGEATEVRSTLNVYDILKYEAFVITKDAVAAIEEVYA